MNVTFLIGNGFDLNQGLDTGYKAFLKYYLAQTTIDPNTKEPDKDILKFKELISDDIEYWADLEKALGEKTIVPPLNTAEGVIKCKRDLDQKLRAYLKAQEETVIFPQPTVFTKNMHDSIYGFRGMFKKAMQLRITEVFAQFAAEQVYYNVITFNYTNTFFLCFSPMLDKLGEHTFKGFRYDHRKGKYIHLHGTTRESMIVGLNDKTQIANTELAEDRRVQCALLKPYMNELSGDLREEEAQKLIDSSTILIVFGMSIGETDKIWWKQIAERLEAEEHTILIFVNYKSDLDPAFIYDVEDAKNEVIERFMTVAEVEDKRRDKIANRVFAFHNTNMFKTGCKVKSTPE